MKGLEIDHDVSQAYKGNKTFALLLYRTQPKGSKAAALSRAMKETDTKFANSKK